MSHSKPYDEYENPAGTARQSYATRVFYDMAVREMQADEARKLEIPAWLQPPPYLTDKQQMMWRDAVLTRGVDWLKPADRFALEQYVKAATELEIFRQRCEAHGYDEKSQAAYMRAGLFFQRCANQLALSTHIRVSHAMRVNNQSPIGAKAARTAEVASQNSQDDLLRGAQSHPTGAMQ